MCMSEYVAPFEFNSIQKRKEDGFFFDKKNINAVSKHTSNMDGTITTIRRHQLNRNKNVPSYIHKFNRIFNVYAKRRFDSIVVPILPLLTFLSQA